MKRKFYFIFFILSFILILISCKNNNYTETEYSYKLSDSITDIEINWRVGDIEITSGDEFSIVETSQDEKAIAPLNYSIIDNKLVLNYNNSNKDLKIILDNKLDYNLIQIETINSIVTASNIVADKLVINGKVGDTKISNCNLNTLESNFTYIGWISNINNSKINILKINHEKVNEISISNNSFKLIEYNFKSGTLNFSNNIFNFINFSTILGKINLTLNADIGFTYYSNLITSIDFETVQYNNKYIYLDGSKQILCKNYKGDINIYRQY
jgi:lipoprotein